MPYWDLIEQAFDDVNIYNGPAAFLAGFERLTEVQRHLLAAYWCQSEINNGGFDQLFINSTGVLAPEGEAGFRAMGLTAVADLLASAIARFGAAYPRDRDERAAVLATFPSDGSRAFGGMGRRFAEFDDPFYKLLPDFEGPADAYAEGSN